EVGAASGEIIAHSTAMRGVCNVIAQVAATNVPVFIHGESGVGKGLIAMTIHRQSRRVAGPFVHVNCSAISSSQAESQLFGHERFALPDSNEQRRGLIELASGGTLFLDDLSELPLQAQAPLLDALQDGRFCRVDGTDPAAVDVRVISATRGDLEAEG